MGYCLLLIKKIAIAWTRLLGSLLYQCMDKAIRVSSLSVDGQGTTNVLSVLSPNRKPHRSVLSLMITLERLYPLSFVMVYDINKNIPSNFLHSLYEIHILENEEILQSLSGNG